MSDRILVIKLGALGDFFQASGPFSAIRDHHSKDHVTLLTSPPYVDFAQESSWFDEVWIDDRPNLAAVGQWLGLRRRLRDAGLKRVYDLQTSERSGHYYRLLWPGPRPEWSGIAPGCSHPHANPDRDYMHTIDRQAEQLAMAGIASIPEPDCSWVNADTTRFQLESRYVLLMPGGAAHRSAKRWPSEHYLTIGRQLVSNGIQPVLIGSREEKSQFGAIADAEPAIRDLSGETRLQDLVALARDAVAALGNDTGPMHIAAMAGCPTTVLFSSDSDPALCAPQGPHVTVIHRPSLSEISPAEVFAALTSDMRTQS